MTRSDEPGSASRLAQQASRGDREALEALLQRFLPELRAFVRLQTGPRILARESPDDLVQSVCREVLANLADFDYRSDLEFKNWLLVAALRKVQDRGRYYAAEKRDAAREWGPCVDPQLLSGYASLLTPSRVAIGREEVARFESAFDQLPADYREVITMHRLLGLDHGEIAARMDRSEAASRVLLHRALARLGRLLGSADPEGL